MTVLKRTLAIILFAFLIQPAHAAAPIKAPDFVVGTSKTGQKITLSSYKGKVVYLDFWASWCIPCKDSFPWMNEMQDKYGKNGLVVLAINLDENREAAKTFLDKIPGNFTIAYNPDGSIASKYQVEVMPTSFLIDKKGNLVYKKLGFKHKEKSKMEAALKKVLASR